jgi:hypothetical protein
MAEVEVKKETGLVEIEATSTKLKLAGRTAKIAYDFGKTLDEAVAKFGKEVVHSNFKANCTVTIQSGMRHLAEAGKTDKEIQDVYNTWKPGVARVKVAVDPVAALIAKFPTLDPAKQAELLNSLKELQKAKAGK